jgi:two-component system LytT family sensor kinase
VLFSWKYRYPLIVLLAGYSCFNIYLTVGDKLFNFDVPFYHLFILLLLVVFGIWELNRGVVSILDNISSRLRSVNPLIILFVFSLGNVILVSAFSLQLLYLALDMPLWADFDHLKLLLAFGFRVNLFLHCVNAIVFYMDRYRESQVEAEKLKKRSVEAQFDALRNQINPHFLFNCFSALSTLVYKDADTSARFIAQLSSVYRYLLYNQEKRIIPLSEEIKFLESYFYLLRIRFGDNMVIRNAVSPDLNDYYIPPAVLQLLIENAIKHNVISKKDPLVIELSRADECIVVRNNLQMKSTPSESSKIGLKNILERYRLLTDKPVEIINSGEFFIVKVPLLQLDLHESPYR